LSRLAPNLPLNPKTADEVGLSLALWTYEMSPLQFTHLWRSLLPAYVPEWYVVQRRDLVEVLSNPVHKVVSFGQDNFLSPRGWAVKTWTSRKFVDGWICGTNEVGGWYSACLWLGNQTNEPMLGASSEVGSYLWSLIMQARE
jgi:membrane carboxypeptidase/penicillin-binding protein PbpC